MNTVVAKKKLTRKQKAFVDEYVATGNGAQSALKAYDLKSSQPELIAASMAAENLRKPHILDAIQEALPDEVLGEKHRALLNSTRLEHMVFPLGPKDGEIDDTKLTDEEIVLLLASVNCTVRKIVHGDIARHVYFWSVDSSAVKGALDMAYKLKGLYAPDKHVSVNLTSTVPNAKLKKLAEKLNGR